MTGQEWLNAYYGMDKEELFKKCDPKTLNEIRKALGDQAFINQWKLTEKEFDRITKGSPPKEKEPEKKEPVKKVETKKEPVKKVEAKKVEAKKEPATTSTKEPQVIYL
jgi:hypothetical protein